MRISDWSSDVCSSDLPHAQPVRHQLALQPGHPVEQRKMRVVGGGKIGKMPPDAVIRQLRDMVGTEMRGKELEGADTDMAARDTGENRARMRAPIGRAACRERGGQDV